MELTDDNLDTLSNDKNTEKDSSKNEDATNPNEEIKNNPDSPLVATKPNKKLLLEGYVDLLRDLENIPELAYIVKQFYLYLVYT